MVWEVQVKVVIVSFVCIRVSRYRHAVDETCTHEESSGCAGFALASVMKLTSSSLLSSSSSPSSISPSTSSMLTSLPMAFGSLFVSSLGS